MNKIDSISFKIDNMDLDEVSSFKYLGIVINNRLTWQDHVDQMFSKINRRVVRGGLDHVSRKIKRSFHNSRQIK